MELTDFLEMDMLGEHDAEKLMESAMQLQQIRRLYEAVSERSRQSWIF